MTSVADLGIDAGLNFASAATTSKCYKVQPYNTSGFLLPGIVVDTMRIECPIMFYSTKLINYDNKLKNFQSKAKFS